MEWYDPPCRGALQPRLETQEFLVSMLLAPTVRWWMTSAKERAAPRQDP
ncbi:MAG: hypothetical protein HRT36_08110 [Alphaproteobacteria bacterium]|nr:hypothetical protein [Alphaproteobacteria bacterium]